MRDNCLLNMAVCSSNLEKTHDIYITTGGKGGCYSNKERWVDVSNFSLILIFSNSIDNHQ